MKNTKLSRPRNRSPSFRPSLKMAMAMGEAGNFLPFFFSSINKSGAAELPRVKTKEPRRDEADLKQTDRSLSTGDEN